MSWTRERTELLKRYWADGESASRIAYLLGGFEHCDDGGRNAVIGKVHRLKLAGRETAVSSRPPRPGKTADRVASNKGKRTERKPIELSSPGAATRPVEPISLDIPITELRPGQCKWAARRRALPLLRARGQGRRGLLRLPQADRLPAGGEAGEALRHPRLPKGRGMSKPWMPLCIADYLAKTAPFNGAARAA